MKTCCILLLLTQTAVAAQISEGAGKANSWSIEKLSLEPVEPKPKTENIRLLNISVRRASDSEAVRFSAVVHIVRIRDAFVAGNRLVVFGDAVRPNVVEILDLERRASVDWFVCYQPRRISDHWIAYSEFYFGELLGPVAVTPVLLVYDLARTPAENRIGSPPGMTFPRPIDDNSNVVVAVGFPVFPRINARERSYRIAHETERAAQSFDAGTLTLLPSMKLVFRVWERLPGRGLPGSPSFLGVVDLSRGLEDAPSQLVPLPTDRQTGIERIEAIDAGAVRLVFSDGVDDLIVQLPPD